MPILTLDIGNTQIKWGVYHGDQLLSLERFSTHPTEHEHARLKQFIQGFERHPSLDAVVVSSVVPAATKDLKEALASMGLNLPLLEAIPKTLSSAVKMDQYPAEQIGPDRWVDAVGALAEFPEKTCLIVDFGTATTLDVVQADGQFQGGIITPGLNTFSGILTQKTALLPPIPQVLPTHTLGKNTLECLQSGIYLGYMHLVSGLIQQVKSQYQAQQSHTPFLTISTGGLGELYQHLCHSSEGRFQPLDVSCPELTLLGLKKLYQTHLHGQAAPLQSHVLEVLQ